MVLTDEQCQEAIGQMISKLGNELAAYKAGTGEYRTVSARDVLRELGYDPEQVTRILHYIAAGGFDYCLDHKVRMSGHHEARGEFPHRDVCYWGADQLESRLQCLSNVPFHLRHRG